MKLLGLATALSLAGAAALVACAPDNNVSSSNDAAGGSENSGASAGDGASSGEGAGFGFGGNNSTGSAMECASESIEAELAPLTMYITFDKSGSMDDDDKWTNATTALKAFFADPAAADLEVALRFFPEGQCSENDCNVNACATPNVNVGALTADVAPTDTHEAALVAAINGQDPGGATPISAALDGGIQWSAAYLAEHPTHKVVVILVTDGEPNGCEEDINAIANIAASGLLDDVVTYTVGLVGSNEADLQQIAMNGGGSGFFVGNGNTEAELLAALQAIQGELIACELPVPVPTMGEFNPELVNVTYTPGAGGNPTTFGNVADEAACGSGGGWYYDNPAAPTMINLCPGSCDLAQGDLEGKIEVVLGCETIPG